MVPQPWPPRLKLHPASGYHPSAAEGTDSAGAHGTWVTWGPGADTVFLAGVTGVALDTLLV